MAEICVHFAHLTEKSLDCFYTGTEFYDQKQSCRQGMGVGVGHNLAHIKLGGCTVMYYCRCCNVVCYLYGQNKVTYKVLSDNK